MSDVPTQPYTDSPRAIVDESKDLRILLFDNMSYVIKRLVVESSGSFFKQNTPSMHDGQGGWEFSDEDHQDFIYVDHIEKLATLIAETAEDRGFQVKFYALMHEIMNEKGCVKELVLSNDPQEAVTEVIYDSSAFEALVSEGQRLVFLSSQSINYLRRDGQFKLRFSDVTPRRIERVLKQLKGRGIRLFEYV